MLKETKEVRRSLVEHTNKLIFKKVIDGCRLANVVHPTSGLEIKKKKDFREFLKTLKKTPEDMETLYKVTWEQFQEKSFNVEAVDSWCEAKDFTMLDDMLEVGTRFMKQTQGGLVLFQERTKTTGSA